MLFKLGVVKYYWEESENVTEESYNNLTLDELTILTADDNIEIIRTRFTPNK